jgi:hypothetical protein
MPGSLWWQSSTAQLYILYQDPTGAPQWVAAASQPGAAGIADAPGDGTYYGRHNYGWASVAPIASPALTGVPTGPTASVGTSTAQLATTAFVINQVAAAVAGVSNIVVANGLSGGGTGAVNIGISPNGILNASLATMAAHTYKGNNTGSAATPIDVTVAQLMADLGAAPLASPTFTGVPAAPTPAVNTNTTQLATTAFVLGQASGVVPNPDSGAGAVGTSNAYARADHVHPAPSGGGAAVVRSYLAGLTLSTAGASTAFNVAAGIAADRTNTIMMPLPALSKNTGSWAAGNNTGALDVGTIAASTWYHAFVIGNPAGTIFDVLISLSPTAPTMPSGFTYLRRIGSLLTNASSQWWKFFQDGDYFNWDLAATDVNSLQNPGTTAVLRTLTVPTGVRVRAKCSALVQNLGTGGQVSQLYCSDPSITDTAPDNVRQTATAYSNTSLATSSMGGGMFECFTNTSAQIRTRFTYSDANIYFFIGTHGWFDRRGQDL